MRKSQIFTLEMTGQSSILFLLCCGAFSQYTGAGSD